MVRVGYSDLPDFDYADVGRRDSVRILYLGQVLGVITVEITETEAVALSVAARAMILAYEREGKITEEAYLELVKAAEKLDQSLWGPVNAC